LNCKNTLAISLKIKKKKHTGLNLIPYYSLIKKKRKTHLGVGAAELVASAAEIKAIVLIRQRDQRIARDQ